MSARAAVIQHLLATGTTLYSLVGTRVYPGRLAEGWNNTTAAVCVDRPGGAPDPLVGVDNGVFSIRCYGGSPLQSAAESVADAVLSRLDRQYSQSTSQGRIVWGRCRQRISSWDPDFERCPVEILLMDVTVD